MAQVAIVIGALFASLVLSTPDDQPVTSEVDVLGRVISRRTAPLEPTTGTLLGSGIRGVDGFIATRVADRRLGSLESAISRNFDISQHHYGWADTFPTSTEQADLNNGRIPLISWEGARLRAIVDGSFDPLIKSRALAIAELEMPVFLSWGYEMNVGSHKWSGASSAVRKGANRPARFVAAWRRIQRIFAAEGATNTVWVWSPAARSSPATEANHWRRYYPGNDHVDWIGIVSNDRDVRRAGEGSRLSPLIGPIYNEFSSKKPLMLETGLVPGRPTSEKWLVNARAAIRTRLSGIKAFVYSVSGSSGIAEHAERLRPFTDDEHFNSIFSKGAPDLTTPWVSVQESGADGSGLSDDTDEFRTALGTGQRIVYVPAGTYILGSQIDIPSNTTLWIDEGATILAAEKDWGDTGMFGIGAVSHVTIMGGELDGRKSTNPSGRLFGIKVLSSNPSDVRIAGISIVDMPGVDETGQNGGDGIYIGSGTEILIDRVVLNGNVRQGISITGTVRDITIRKSLFANTTGSRPGAGIDIEPNPGGKTVRDVSIVDSVFLGNNRGIQLTLNEDPTGAMSDISIIGNTIKRNRIEGMLIVGGPTVFRQLVIRDNKIQGNYEDGISVDRAVQGVISRNEINSNGDVGIRINNDPAELRVEDNILKGNDSGPAEVTNSPGVQFTSNRTS